MICALERNKIQSAKTATRLGGLKSLTIPDINMLRGGSNKAMRPLIQITRCRNGKCNINLVRGFTALPSKRVHMKTDETIVGQGENNDVQTSRKDTINLSSMTLPVSLAGPLTVNGHTYHVPLATPDSALVARTQHGCKVLEASGGVHSKVTRDNVTYCPVIVLSSVHDAAAFSKLVQKPKMTQDIKRWFSESTNVGVLESIDHEIFGRQVFIRMTGTCGDTTGAKMVPAAIRRVLEHLAYEWKGPAFHVIEETLNSVEECGKAVVASVTIPNDVINYLLGTNVETICRRSNEKRFLRSRIMDGLNARRIASSIYLATGQDVIPRVEAFPVCETHIVPVSERRYSTGSGGVRVSCVMPSIDVGTVAGECNRLCEQQRSLDLLGVSGPSLLAPGQNAQRLAEIVCATVLAGEVGVLGNQLETENRMAQEQARRSTPTSRQKITHHITSTRQQAPLQAARGISSLNHLASADGKHLINVGNTNSAYVELVAEKCAAEFGWDDPRLTIP